MTKTNENLSNTESPENFFPERENYALKPKNKSRRWKYTKPDIQKQCLICDKQFKVKYNLARQQYSQKNNWGYWTQKESNQHKYLCDACLVKILNGKRFDAFDWIPANKAANFRSYLARGDFKFS
ncbi:hypothetical protein [endosymbiont GvMRE of Glomus versiforme]|uniref:hypothetical protein n=1 Tax=endosymbiont GvMRE of Glomus versiforme TaxID=2039283 RepID=UPI0011C3AC77|nr:hypothetical protein [endosymbiont GvMRE of Glomus versiforme]